MTYINNDRIHLSSNDISNNNINFLKIPKIIIISETTNHRNLFKTGFEFVRKGQPRSAELLSNY